ncbi:uncharacterized protein LOC141929626 [Strix aluco]|uniref:uncharacterized protein LOC141929626 n=1 Tax=Strix aluco TaxID=111821 RepID=UPI003DA55C6F
MAMGYSTAWVGFTASQDGLSTSYTHNTGNRLISFLFPGFPEPRHASDVHDQTFSALLLPLPSQCPFTEASRAPQARGLSRIDKALVSLCQEFLPLLEKAAKDAGKEGLSCSRAAVINVSTKLGSIGLCLGVLEAPMYPYRASKAAQNMVTRCVAAELQDKGILCTAIHPGWVKTDMGMQKAPLTVERSVRGILAVLASLSQDTSGAFLDWEGNSLPW